MISNKLYKYKLPASRFAALLSLWQSLLGVLFLVGGGTMLLMKYLHSCICRILPFQCMWDELVTEYGVHLLKSFTLSPIKKSQLLVICM